MQAGRRLPRAISDPAHGMGNPAAVAEHDEAVAWNARDLDLDAFHRRIDVAGRAAAGGLFTEDVPGFQGVAQFDGDAAAVTEPIRGKRNSKCGANHSCLNA